MLFKIRFPFIFSLLLVTFFTSQAQKYADKNYYLIDSLSLIDVVENEKKILHKSLVKFHSTNDQNLKLEAINYIVENSWDENIWHKYNLWMYEYTKQELGGIFPISSISNLNSGEEILLKYYSKSLNNIGVVNNDEGKLSAALEYYYKSLNLIELLKDSLGLAEIYNNIGNIYAIQDDIEKALEFTEKSLVISKLISSVDNSVTLSNLGNLHRQRGNKEKALLYYKESLEVNKKTNNTVGLAYTYSLIGAFYETEGELDVSLEYLTKSLVVLEDNGHQEGVVGSLTDITRVYLKKGEIIKAKKHGERALKLAEYNGEPLRVSIISEVLSSIYQKGKEWENAFEMEKLHFKMYNSIKNTEIETNLIKQTSKYELDKKQQEIALLSVKNENQELKLRKNKISMLLISIALLFTLILIFVAYRMYKKNQLINKMISKKSEERKYMLQEIHHRVKNNLQAVNSLLRMQSRKTSNKEVISVFKETQSRVISMAKLHEKMYQSGDLMHLNSKEYITTLVEEIVKNYALEKDIKLKLIIGEYLIDSQTMMPLSLIINEVITNSLKYAFEGREKGIITVKLSSVSGITYELIIADNGIGYTTESTNRGLGSKLIQSFARQLNGVLEKTLDKGTVYKLTFANINP